ncbi:hypothetical protein LCGC14_2124730 [marine sediment metagenome]|uniref:Band 7 domain-containing protein n=1 Tax=marine sediment metagenome TaxID=412755 RepID=A0A0F9GZG3_9ZZZZ
MKRFILLMTAALSLALITTGCDTEEVPPGFVGVKKTSGGIEKKILQPGNHSIVWRDRLILIEIQEKISFESGMKIRCEDRMNISLDLKVRHRLKRDSTSIHMALKAQGSRIKWGFRKHEKVGALLYKPIAKVYVDHQAREIARLVVSKYPTDQVRINRAKIKAAIFKQLVERVKGSPIEIMEVMVSNIDPPKIISNAIEKARERKEQIQQEKADQAKKTLVEQNQQKLKMQAEQNTQAMKTLKAKNKLALAKINKASLAEEAEAESIRIKILGRILTPLYLKLLYLENQRVLYSTPGVRVVVPAGSKPLVGNLR